MSFEPQKFFITLMDFFTILLPGALLSFVVKDCLGPEIVGPISPVNGDSQAWLIFFFSSYLLGHFIFLLGSWLDEFYDMARRGTKNHRLKQLARTGKLPLKVVRLLLWLVFKREEDWAVERATAIKKAYLEPLQSSRAVNTFQWAKLRLAMEKPALLAPVLRFEADSKFFRSLVVVLVLLPLATEGNRRQLFAYIGLLLLPLALWRYMEQRHKATSQAYWAVIALEGQTRTVTLAARTPEPGAATHAGGVVYRKRLWRRLQYLIVESATTRDEWVLPKGHVEIGEDLRLTAVREVREETGVLASIRGELARVSYALKGEEVRVQFYLMRALEQWRPSDVLRGHAWHAVADARRLLAHEQNKALLDAAERQRRAIERAP
jgi:8-oxo-dGTP pyrophosphatase MutT (NUDIX family)